MNPPTALFSLSAPDNSFTIYGADEVKIHSVLKLQSLMREYTRPLQNSQPEHIKKEPSSSRMDKSSSLAFLLGLIHHIFIT
jgi:hypothetical protein